MKRWWLIILLMVLPVTAPAATRAITAETHSVFSSIKTALEAFAVDCGRYPSTAAGLAALVQCPVTIESRRWHGPYLDAVPKDAWGNEYRYVCPGRHNTTGFDLYSCGFDGVSKSGGEDLDDINNWDYSSPHGGNDHYANYRELIFDKFGPVILVPLLVIAILGGRRMHAFIFLPQARADFIRRPAWFLISSLIWFLAVGYLAWFIFALPPALMGR